MSNPVSNAVPFFKPAIGEAEIAAVVECLRSGWLTTGPRTTQFEAEFAQFVGAKHAVAVNSCTAGLHLAIACLGLQPGDGVLVPTWTFAATAEVVQYLGGIPILVDCREQNLQIDLVDAQRKLEAAKQGTLPMGKVERVVGIMPVHVGGAMLDMDQVNQFAKDNGLWVVEDAAHSFPASFHSKVQGRELRCGEGTARATCFSFYANKTITTGEGGMVVTESSELADEIRCLSLHGLSSLAWKRFANSANWDYQIMKAGFKYNLTDIASAIGLQQLARAEDLRTQRQELAERYYLNLADCDLLELPENDLSLKHAWHLYPIKLNLEKLKISRNEFCDTLRANHIGFSVHWRPLHLHPLYASQWKWNESDLPTASSLWPRVVSLPIYAGMDTSLVDVASAAVRSILSKARK